VISIILERNGSAKFLRLVSVRIPERRENPLVIPSAAAVRSRTQTPTHRQCVESTSECRHTNQIRPTIIQTAQLWTLTHLADWHKLLVAREFDLVCISRLYQLNNKGKGKIRTRVVRQKGSITDHYTIVALLSDIMIDISPIGTPLTSILF
jgi:hypothetical protein